MTRCYRCGNEHEAEKGCCEYCTAVSRRMPEQSQSEADWMDHVEDHKHEKDYLSDGVWVE